MIPCFWHYGGRGAWCQTIVEFLTRGCEHQMGIGPAVTAVVVVKADAVPSEQQLNADLAQIERGVLIVTANEEGTFRPELITHPRFKVWLQTPAKHQFAHRYLPWGWTPLQHMDLARQYDWSFAGQVTHQRREQCVEVLRTLPHGKLVVTSGFSEGLDRETYADLLQSSKVIPCPSGPITVDSFRFCEALESGAVPIPDGISPRGPYFDYWKRVFGRHFPFAVAFSWNHAPGILRQILVNWDEFSRGSTAWWKDKKQEWIHQLLEDIHA